MILHILLSKRTSRKYACFIFKLFLPFLMTVDKRIVSMIKLISHRNHRGCFVFIGEDSAVNVPTLHDVLAANSSNTCDSILWCHKHGKSLKESTLEKEASDKEKKLMEFYKCKDIQFVSYNDSGKILGQTVDMLVLHDFESLTPNLIALSMETVRGGGIIVILLDNVSSIDAMVHRKNEFLIDDEFVPRYNKRLFTSLVNSSFTIFLDSSCCVLPFTKFNPQNVTYKEVCKQEMPNVGQNIESILVNIAKTNDQVDVVNCLMKSVRDRTERRIYSIQAGRGRGKSVALGLGVARAIDLKYSSIYISAPALENVAMVFDYMCKGLDAIGYTRYKDYKIYYSFKSKRRLVNRIEILKNMKQTIEYFDPFQELKYCPDLLILDEAASIPLPILKTLLLPNLIFMATTTCGYEGTGRAFATKMVEYLKYRVNDDNPFVYEELSMNTSIRYGNNDPVEKWLNDTFLLNALPTKITKCPIPSECELYYVDRDILFSGNSHTEIILREVYGLFVASHYKNSPNDIQILADSPNHEIFALLTTVNSNGEKLPRVLCAVQISFEGKCKDKNTKKGNLIPWIVSDTYYDKSLLDALGVRVVRISVHPDYSSMGYGSRALNCLISLLNDKQLCSISSVRIPCDNENSNILFHDVNDIYIPKIAWIGTSFGVTDRLMNFWKKHYMIPICIKQTVSYVTGEHSVILMKGLNNQTNELVQKYYKNFKLRFIGQMAYSFSKVSPTLCLTLIYNKLYCKHSEHIILADYDLDRLDKYCRGTLDIMQIIDLVPVIARMYFTENVDASLSLLEQSVLLMIGCQNRQVNDVCKMHTLKAYEVNTVVLKLMNALYNALNKT